MLITWPNVLIVASLTRRVSEDSFKKVLRILKGMYFLCHSLRNIVLFYFKLHLVIRARSGCCWNPKYMYFVGFFGLEIPHIKYIVKNGWNISVIISNTKRLYFYFQRSRKCYVSTVYIAFDGFKEHLYLSNESSSA